MSKKYENREVLPTEERYHTGIASFENIYRESINNPDEFWSKAASVVDWTRPWDKVLDEIE